MPELDELLLELEELLEDELELEELELEELELEELLEDELELDELAGEPLLFVATSPPQPTIDTNRTATKAPPVRYKPPIKPFIICLIFNQLSEFYNYR